MSASINDNIEVLGKVLDALTAALPGFDEQVLQRAAAAAMHELGRRTLPWHVTVVTGPKGCNVRSYPPSQKAPVTGTIGTGVQVYAGQDEKGWTPVSLDGWVATALLRGS